jgi:hypothetical protein
MISHHVALACDTFTCAGIRNLNLTCISTNECFIFHKNVHTNKIIHARRCEEYFCRRRYIDFLVTFVFAFILEIYSNRAERIFFVSFLLCRLPKLSNAECNNTIVFGNNLHSIFWKRNFSSFRFEILRNQLFVAVSWRGTYSWKSRRRRAGRRTGT